MAGVSVRALHHYHAIGLLKPADVGVNGYRYYGRAELLRLQQIMFYRELDFSLAEISRILNDPAFDLRVALSSHRQALAERAERFSSLIRTIDRTIAKLEKDETMQDEDDLFEGFSAEKQAEYESYLVQRFGPETGAEITASQSKLASLSPGERESFLAQLADVESDLVAAMRSRQPPESAGAQRLVARHHQWVALSWPTAPNAETYSGLAQLYVDHPEFRARYESMEPGFTEWLVGAMRHFAETLPAR